MRSIASLLNPGNRLLVRLLFLLLLWPPLDPLRNPLPAQPPAPRTAQRDDIQSQVDSLTCNFQSLSETLTSQLRDFMLMFSSQTQSSCQPRLGPDAGESQPGVTVGESRMFQGEGTPSRTPPGFPPLSHDFRAPSSRAPPRSAPRTAPRASARQAPHPQPPFGAPPQPSTSGWVPPGPPPPRSHHDSSESEASESESVSNARDTASARLAELIYEVCPDSRPLFDAKAPRCGFEAWFGAAALPNVPSRCGGTGGGGCQVGGSGSPRQAAIARHTCACSRLRHGGRRHFYLVTACEFGVCSACGFPPLGFHHLLRDGEAGTFG